MWTIDMFFCNKAKLYNSNDSVYLRLQLQHIVNFFKWILGRKSWLTLYHLNNSCFLHLLASQCFSSMLVKWNQLRVVNFRQIFNAGLKFRNFSTVAK